MRKTLVRKGLRELWEHKIQYIFLIIILALGVATYSALFNLTDSRVATFDKIYKKSNFMDLQVQFQYDVIMNESSIRSLLDSSGITSQCQDVEYRLSCPVLVNHSTKEGKRLTKGIVLGYHAFNEEGSARNQAVNTLLFYTDTTPHFTSSSSNQCYIEHHFAKNFELDKGGSVTVSRAGKETQLTILKHVNVPEFFIVKQEHDFISSEWTFCILCVPIETANSIFFGSTGTHGTNETMVNDIVFRFKEGVILESVKQQVQEAFDKVGVPIRIIEKEENPARAFIWGDIEGDREVINLFPVIIFIVSGFGLAMALSRMIQSHKSEIGIFKALGVKDRVIFTYFLVIGLFVALFGIILGVIFSYPLHLFFTTMLNDYYDFAIKENFLNTSYYFVSGVIALVICIICTLLPSWKAIRIRPIDAIQKEEGLADYKVGFIERKMSQIKNLPIPMKLTTRYFSRKPLRVLTTILGVALALMIFLSFYLMVSSFSEILHDVKAANDWDYEIQLTGFCNEIVIQQWASVDDAIEIANPGICFPTHLTQGNDTVEVIMFALNDIDSSYNLSLSKGDIANDGIIISEYIAKKLDIDVGNEIYLTVPIKEDAIRYSLRDVPITVSGIHTNPVGLYAFMNLKCLQEICNIEGQVNVIYLHVAGNNLSLATKNMIITMPGIASMSSSSDIDAQFDYLFEMFMRILYIILALSVILAVAIVYNMFMVNAAERKREYATMKTLGTSLSRIGNLIFIEGFVLTTIGILLGTIMGYLLAWYLVVMRSSDMFEGVSLELRFSWMGLIIGILMIIAVVFIVSLLIIRHIHKIDIADVTRERTA